MAAEQALGSAWLIVWEPELGKTVHWTPRPDMATSFALKLGKITGCGLCSTATKSRAVGWARELPVCSVMFPCWEDWMLYSTVGGAMNLFSCLGRVGELAAKPARLFACGLDWSWPMSQFSGGTETLTVLCGWSALPAVFSAQALLGYPALQVFWLGFLVVWGWKLHSAACGAMN